MDSGVIEDLKQFIATTVSQQTVDMRDDIDNIRTDVHNLDVKLTGKIDNLSTYLAEALDNSNEANGSQIRNHEKRINKLEKNVVLLQAS
jgi:hypothetical protein